jgi:hypothetical protein
MQRIETKPVWATAPRAFLTVLGVSILSMSSPAQAQMNPCPYTNDGDCDEPNGLGLCAWGTDTADCSNPYSNYGSGSGYAGGGTGQPQPPVTGTPGVNVTGTWNINANGWRGTLTITPIGGSTLTGNINFGSQEPITDVSYNAATGQLYFERPQVTQTYTGQVSGNQITGTFTYSGATYNWSASR